MDAAKIEKVKKGLAACFMIDGTCSTCPYFAECYPLQGESKRGLPCKDTVALIDELTQEIEQLRQRPDVVRCKDCKLWTPPSFGYIQAQLGDCRALGATRAEWFCADGIRKDGGT